MAHSAESETPAARSIAGAVASWAAAIAHSPAVRAAVVDRVVDTVGVALAAAELGNVTAALGVRAFGGGGSQVWPNWSRSSAAGAAFVNGMAAHSLEFDDYSEAAAGHPGSIVVSSCLAFAQQRRLSGADVVRGVAVGYEVFERLGKITATGSMHSRGFHATAVMGPLAAAAACMGALDPADASALTSALGVAGSASGGLLAFLEDGSWTKRFHAGWAATAGIVAAELGSLGFVGPPSVIDGRYGVVASFGTLEEVGPDERERVLCEVPGDSAWAVQASAYKMFACCGYLHAALTALFDLLDAAPEIVASEVEGVEVGLFKAAFQIVVEPEEVKRKPRNAVDSQFSLFHAVAVALTDRAAGVAQFDDSAAARADLDDLRRRVSVVHDPEIERHFPDKYGARVTVRLRDGRHFEAQCLDPFGSRFRPPSRDDLDQKFLKGAGDRLGTGAEAADFLARLRKLDDTADLDRLYVP